MSTLEIFLITAGNSCREGFQPYPSVLLCLPKMTVPTKAQLHISLGEARGLRTGFNLKAYVVFLFCKFLFYFSLFLKIFFIILMFLCVRVYCHHVCKGTHVVQRLWIRKRHQIPWTWSYGHFASLRVGAGSQPWALCKAEPAPQPLCFVFLR